MRKIKKFLLAKSIGIYINTLSYINPGKAALLAYRIFSEPRDGRLLKEQLPDILKQAETKTYIHDNQQFQTYTWRGNDNVILLVHGWESNASRWERMLPYLQKSGSTIIAIDAPAHGLSGGTEFNIPQYAKFIDIIVRETQPIFLIGHSLGGAACVYYQSAYQHPSIAKMILLGAPSDLKILIQNYIALLSLNNRMVLLLENYFIERFKFKLEDFSGKIFGGKLKLSGIIAHDIDDEVVSLEEARKISGSWKHAQFIETKGLGHSMHDEKLYKQLSDFLFGADTTSTK
ncbi:MAG: alpha/beta fold hydrolase [Flavobacterium sp.]|nr:alpha/beta fold hydrolase [Flavobacterium sp.]